MATHIWTVLCSKTLVDQLTNNVSLIETIEQVSVPENTDPNENKLLPLEHEVVSFLVRSNLDEPEKVSVRANLETANGDVLRGGQTEVDLTVSTRARSIMKFGILPVHGPGIYYFVIETLNEDTQDWLPVTRIPLQVVYLTNSAQQSPAPESENS